MPLMQRRLGMDGSPTSMLADIGSLLGPLGIPAAVAGVLGKPINLSPDDLSVLHELLGDGIKLGKRFVRLSSVNPAKNTAILHDATAGERLAMPIDDFLKSWKTIGETTPDIFPEDAVMSHMGERAPEASLGPRGGRYLKKRVIPPTSTR